MVSQEQCTTTPRVPTDLGSALVKPSLSPWGKPQALSHYNNLPAYLEEKLQPLGTDWKPLFARKDRL